MAEHRINQDPSEPGFLSVVVEIEISGSGNRDRVLRWLQNEFELGPELSTFVHEMSFGWSTEPVLIDLDLVVKAKSFKDASRITTDILSDIEHYVHDKSRDRGVGFEQMSRTLMPA